MVVEK